MHALLYIEQNVDSWLVTAILTWATHKSNIHSLIISNACRTVYASGLIPFPLLSVPLQPTLAFWTGVSLISCSDSNNKFKACGTLPDRVELKCLYLSFFLFNSIPLFQVCVLFPF